MNIHRTTGNMTEIESRYKRNKVFYPQRDDPSGVVIKRFACKNFWIQLSFKDFSPFCDQQNTASIMKAWNEVKIPLKLKSVPTKQVDTISVKHVRVYVCAKYIMGKLKLASHVSTCICTYLRMLQNCRRLQPSSSASSLSQTFICVVSLKHFYLCQNCHTTFFSRVLVKICLGQL